MNNTEITSNTIEDRNCVTCGSTLSSGNAKRKFCSDACRTENHRRKQSQTIKQQEETVKQQQSELNAIKAAPITRTESVREVDPEWQLAYQAYQAQLDQCEYLRNQLSSIKADQDKLTDTRRGAYLGAGIGLGCVMILMALRYDTRKYRPLGVSYVVVSLFGLFILGLIGHLVGNQIHKLTIFQDEEVDSQKRLFIDSEEEIRVQLESEETKLKLLQNRVNEIPQYLRETITEVEEVRSSTLLA